MDKKRHFEMKAEQEAVVQAIADAHSLAALSVRQGALPRGGDWDKWAFIAILRRLLQEL